MCSLSAHQQVQGRHLPFVEVKLDGLLGATMLSMVVGDAHVLKYATRVQEFNDALHPFFGVEFDVCKLLGIYSNLKEMPSCFWDVKSELPVLFLQSLRVDPCTTLRLHDHTSWQAG